MKIQFGFVLTILVLRKECRRSGFEFLEMKIGFLGPKRNDLKNCREVHG
jgi:hypothetical protein